jgi:hypothetical protein
MVNFMSVYLEPTKIENLICVGAILLSDILWKRVSNANLSNTLLSFQRFKNVSICILTNKLEGTYLLVKRETHV